MDASALPHIVTAPAHSPYPRDSPTTSESSHGSPVQSFDFPRGFAQNPTLLPPAPPASAASSSSRAARMHPYARLASKKDSAKRRKIWNHALEKSIFSSQEISTIGATNRRPIYIASLEAHIDQMLGQLFAMELYPVPVEKLELYTGLNCKTAKSMVAGLHYDASQMKMKLLEIERANRSLEDMVLADGASGAQQGSY